MRYGFSANIELLRHLIFCFNLRPPTQNQSKLRKAVIKHSEVAENIQLIF